MESFMSEYKVVDYEWIETLVGTIGLVVVENKVQHQLCYIGIVPEPTKIDTLDAEEVIKFGTLFPTSAAKTFFPYLENTF